MIKSNIEIFKDISGYEGIYQISNFGRVKSLIDTHGNIRKTEKILKEINTRHGYKTYSLYKNKKSKRILTHRLVADAFIPNPNNYVEVNHKDENKANNSVDNLEWCTRKYNCNYGTAAERTAEKTSMPVYQYDKNFNLIKKWNRTSECEKHGYKHQGIQASCKGRRMTHKGFIWSYKMLNEEEIKETSDKLNAMAPRRVYQFTLDGKLVREFKSTKDCMNNGYKNIRRYCISGRIYKGYKWSFNTSL